MPAAAYHPRVLEVMQHAGLTYFLRRGAKGHRGSVGMIHNRCPLTLRVRHIEGVGCKASCFSHLANKRFKQALVGYLLPLPVGVLGK